ncbi:MAG TPA: alkaline phosphatase D family protein [Streptosporangiaceae bacterium]
MTRRAFLATAGSALLPFSGSSPALSPPSSPPPYAGSARRLGDPFRLGVASGEPTSTGVVLWTRIAPRPLAEDGYGGMPPGDVDVEWQLADDERFRQVIRSGQAVARRADGGSVHVEVESLQPGGEYFYRFRTAGQVSPVGRTLTAPAPGSLSAPLTFCAVSCAHYEHGYFTAYRRLTEQDPDLVVHLGDYMYEYAPGHYRAASGMVRRHTAGKCQTLTDYRRRHAQYKSDADLQAAHAAAPWVVAWDDHEIENNWAGDHPGSPDVPGFGQRKHAAMRAYYENMPLRATSRPKNGTIHLYRRLAWGGLATFHVLDTRQFRDDQPCNDGIRPDCDVRLEQGRVLAGPAQLRWLDAGLRASRARWDVLAQQIFLAQRDVQLGPGRDVLLDTWDGYTAERDRLLSGIVTAGTRNPVVLTGDIHTAYANTLLTNFDDPSSQRVGVELVATSIASDGDGYHDPAGNAALRAENPHIAFVDQRRGYVLCRVTPDELRADFRTLPYITRKGAPATTAAGFTIPDRARSLDI